MTKNNNNNSGVGGCIGIVFILLSFSIALLGSMLYLDMEPKNKVKEEIIRQGDEISISNEELSKYIGVLEDLGLNYTTHKDGDKTTIKINRPNK